MAEEVEFKNDDELRDKFLKAFLDKYLEETGHNIKDVVLIKEIKDDGVYYYFRRKKND